MGIFLRTEIVIESFLNPDYLVQGLAGGKKKRRKKKERIKGETEGNENKAQDCL